MNKKTNINTSSVVMISIIVLLLTISAYLLGVNYGESNLINQNKLEDTNNDKNNIENEDYVEGIDSDTYTIQEIETMYGSDETILNTIKMYFGKEISDTALIDQDGKETTLFEEFKDTNFIMEIMSTTCPVCERTVPNIQEYVSNNDIPYVLISAYDTLDTMQTLLNDNNAPDVKFYIAKDPEEFYSIYNLSFVPASFYVDKNNITQMIIAGDATAERIEETANKSFNVYE